eukprot:4159881-Alexandrium_andersonii.AAC.1
MVGKVEIQENISARGQKICGECNQACESADDCLTELSKMLKYKKDTDVLIMCRAGPTKPMCDMWVYVRQDLVFPLHSISTCTAYTLAQHTHLHYIATCTA